MNDDDAGREDVVEADILTSKKKKQTSQSSSSATASAGEKEWKPEGVPVSSSGGMYGSILNAASPASSPSGNTISPSRYNSDKPELHDSNSAHRDEEEEEDDRSDEEEDDDESSEPDMPLGQSTGMYGSILSNHTRAQSERPSNGASSQHKKMKPSDGSADSQD